MVAPDPSRYKDFMNTILINLKDLQAVDDQIQAFLAEEKKAALHLSSGQELLTGLTSQVLALNQAVEAAKVRHLELELEINNLTARREKNLLRQSLIKNANEQDALLKEATHLATSVDNCENEALSLLDQLEKDEADLSALKIRLNTQKAQFKQLTDDINHNLAQNKLGQEQLRQKRERLLAIIPIAELTRYDNLMSTRAGRAVSPADGNTCLACSLGLPPQTFNQLQKNDEIIVCPNCARVLFWLGHPDFQPNP
ncbi:MAG: zinc ribbon domain-containing protein [Candidatus Adiutrix sp.]